MTDFLHSQWEWETEARVRQEAANVARHKADRRRSRHRAFWWTLAFLIVLAVALMLPWWIG